jgi:hypothetical protein
MSNLGPDMSDELYDCSNLNTIELVWTFSGHVPVPNLSSERVFINEWPEPISSHPTGLTGMVDRSGRFALTTPTASFFQIPINGTPPPLLWVASS